MRLPVKPAPRCPNRRSSGGCLNDLQRRLDRIGAARRAELYPCFAGKIFRERGQKFGDKIVFDRRSQIEGLQGPPHIQVMSYGFQHNRMTADDRNGYFVKNLTGLL